VAADGAIGAPVFGPGREAAGANGALLCPTTGAAAGERVVGDAAGATGTRGKTMTGPKTGADTGAVTGATTGATTGACVDPMMGDATGAMTGGPFAVGLTVGESHLQVSTMRLVKKPQSSKTPSYPSCSSSPHEKVLDPGMVTASSGLVTCKSGPHTEHGGNGPVEAEGEVECIVGAIVSVMEGTVVLEATVGATVVPVMDGIALKPVDGTSLAPTCDGETLTNVGARDGTPVTRNESPS